MAEHEAALTRGETAPDPVLLRIGDWISFDETGARVG
jgi:hypothetical protein